MEYVITQEEVDLLKEVLSEDLGHSAHIIRTEIKENILPRLFSPPFEVGKYYHYVDKAEECNFVVKCTEVVRNNSVKGYGIDLIDNRFDEDELWWDIDGYNNVTEITREEFLQEIKKYAVETLGFVKGAYIKDIVEDIKIVGDIIIGGGDTLYAECNGGIKCVIFAGGSFCDIIEPKEAENTVWKPTMELRYRKEPYSSPVLLSSSIGYSTILQQKWEEQNTGAEEWRDIKID